MGNNAKRIAKNSLAMYARMFVVLLISLYSSRVVLQTLGVEDYGTYCLVGSIVALFSSLRSIFASSTQRFLNFEMGRNNHAKLQSIFNTSIIVNLIIAIVFVVLVEIVGVWFINNKINIDVERIFAAKIVFQCSVLTAVISLLTTPYDAAIIAHERMNVYAIFSILESCLKLLVVILLPYLPFDKLISYAIMLVIVACLIRLGNTVYCRLNFQECKFSFNLDVNCLKEMTSFAGWNFLGNTAYSLTHNGIGLVMNVFGGAIVNAAKGVAYNVNSIAEQFINNIVVVVNPFTIKTYANGNIDKFYKIIFLSSKMLFSVQLCLTLPIIFMTNELLNLWLGDVPLYSVLFLQLLLINTQIRSLHPSIDTIFKAIGRLREYQIIEIIILSSPLLISYITLKNDLPFYSVFIAIVVVNIIAMFCVVLLAHKLAGLQLRAYTFNVIIPCILTAFLATGLFYLKMLISYNSLIVLLLYTLFSLIIVLSFMWFIGFTSTEKSYVYDLLKKKQR